MTKTTERPKKRGAIIDGKALTQKPLKFPFLAEAKATMQHLIDPCRFSAVLPYLQLGSEFTAVILVNEPYDLAEVSAFFYDPPPARGDQTLEYWLGRMASAGVFTTQAERQGLLDPNEWLDVVALAPYYIVKHRKKIEPKEAPTAELELIFDDEDLEELEANW
jgi:hypothetical protein